MYSSGISTSRTMWYLAFVSESIHCEAVDRSSGILAEYGPISEISPRNPAASLLDEFQLPTGGESRQKETKNIYASPPSFLRNRLARTTDVLVLSMPSGSNAENGYVRIKRGEAFAVRPTCSHRTDRKSVLGGNSLTRPKIKGSCATA